MNSFTSFFKPAAVRATFCVVFAVVCFLACDRLIFFLASRTESQFNRCQAELNLQVDFPRDFFSTLIFGSSRTYRGIHPWYFQTELGQNARKEAKGKKRLKYSYLFYRQFKALHGKPQVVIYGLDYFAFKLVSKDLALMQLDKHYAKVTEYSGGVSLLLANKPHFDQLFIDMLNFVEESRKMKERGNKPQIPQLIDPFVGYAHQAGVLSERKPPDFEKLAYRPFPGMEGEYLQKLLEELDRDGVITILVMIPDYIGTYETNFEHGKFIRDIENLARPFANTHILNYNDPAVFPLHETRYFLDGGYGSENSHLSKEGARVFNAMLLRDIRRYYQGGN